MPAGENTCARVAVGTDMDGVFRACGSECVAQPKKTRCPMSAACDSFRAESVGYIDTQKPWNTGECGKCVVSIHDSLLVRLALRPQRFKNRTKVTRDAHTMTF